MNAQKDFLRRISISGRIRILILIVSIFPIILVGCFGYFQARKALHETAYVYNQKLADTIKQNIDLRLQAFVTLSDELIINSNIRDILESYETMDTSQKYWAVQTIYDEVRSKYTRLADVCDIRIVTAHNIPIYSTGFLYLDSLQDQINFDRISQHSGSLLCYSARYNEEPYLVLSRKISKLYSEEDLGYIIMHINPNILEELYSIFHLEENAFIALLDSFGGAITGDVPISDSMQNTFADIASLEKSEDTVRYHGNHKENFIYYSEMAHLNLTLVVSMPYTALLSSIYDIFLAILLLLLACILLSIIVSEYIRKSITTPLNNLVSNVRQASDMNFDTDSGKQLDELDFMENAYEHIIETLKDTVTKSSQEQEDKRKAEIKLLQAQINPHFLFNTLDSLRFTAMMSHADTVSQGLSSLSHILRNSIIDDKSYITIAKEIQCIEDYIEIQKIRYGEFIELHNLVDADAEDCMIMKFLLQPIVENSIIHGMHKNKALHITIHGRILENKVEISISDDGLGFDIEAQTDKDSNIIKSNKLSGIGLENIRQRLELEFQKDQSFSIFSEKDKGTTVTIRYPVIKKED